MSSKPLALPSPYLPELDPRVVVLISFLITFCFCNGLLQGVNPNKKHCPSKKPPIQSKYITKSIVVYLPPLKPYPPTDVVDQSQLLPQGFLKGPKLVQNRGAGQFDGFPRPPHLFTPQRKSCAPYSSALHHGTVSSLPGLW